MAVKVGLKFIEKWNESIEKRIFMYDKEPVEKGKIVFYGPSNFTRWNKDYGNEPLNEVLLGKSGKQCCINRGFGSSCTEHHLYYYPRVVRPLEPEVLVYAPGYGNAKGFGYTSEEIWDLGQRVIEYAMTDFPDLKVYICGLNLYRDRNKPNYEAKEEYDSWLREYAQNTPNCTYVDITNFEPLHRDDIFAEDGVHFNKLGYEIYADLFREVLKDELALY